MGEEWTLAENYADIFRDKVLTKRGRVARVPVLDIGTLMFREREFPDDADARSLQATFREAFPQRDEDFEKIFLFRSEDSEKIFSGAAKPQDYRAAIREVLVQDVTTAQPNSSCRYGSGHHGSR